MSTMTQSPEVNRLDPPTPLRPAVSKAAFWAGWVITIVLALMLTFSAAMKLARPEAFTKEFGRLGYAEKLAVGIGIVELACMIVYLIPRTSVLGAILLTGYLGGAVATHVRVGDAFISPAVVGAMVWLSLCLREPRLRVLLPLRRPSSSSPI